MLTCIELHTALLLFHVDIKMERFRREDDDTFLHDIIYESGEDAEYDGSQYLNDTGEGDADHSEQMAAIILSIFSAFTNYVAEECVIVLIPKRFHFDVYVK